MTYAKDICLTSETPAFMVPAIAAGAMPLIRTVDVLEEELPPSPMGTVRAITLRGEDIDADNPCLGAGFIFERNGVFGYSDARYADTGLLHEMAKSAFILGCDTALQFILQSMSIALDPTGSRILDGLAFTGSGVVGWHKSLTPCLDGREEFYQSILDRSIVILPFVLPDGGSSHRILAQRKHLCRTAEHVYRNQPPGADITIGTPYHHRVIISGFSSVPQILK